MQLTDIISKPAYSYNVINFIQQQLYVDYMSKWKQFDKCKNMCCTLPEC